MPTLIFREKPTASFIAEFPEHPEIIVQLLFNRGFTSQQDVELFLYPEFHHVPDPYLFRDMHRACDRIVKAIHNSELIAIHGDYDADGVAATAILDIALKRLGAKTIVYIPHREREGYGLHHETIHHVADQGTKLIITCDCGTTNIDEVQAANDRGIDVIITDHHQPDKQHPNAYAIVNPWISDEPYPFRSLAGGGVAYKLVQGLLRHKDVSFSEHEREAIEKWLLDLVAIATVSDMVSLIGENRIFAKFGLMVLRKTRRIGLQKLLKTTSLNVDKLTTDSINYYLAPRINAAGRMDHANIAFLLLTTDDEALASELALRIDQKNTERQQLTEILLAEALKDAQSQSGNAVFTYGEQFPVGIIGLLANRLVKRCLKPVFVFCREQEHIVGSGRSPKGVNILKGIEAVKHLLSVYGGHPQACGLRCNVNQLSAVIEGMQKYFNNLPAPSSENTLIIEGEISFTDITWQLIDYLSKFEPFGVDNPEPLFFSRNIKILHTRYVGAQENYLKTDLRQDGITMPAISFEKLEQPVERGDSVNIAYFIRINEWDGNRSIQLILKNVTVATENV